jgi:hypothetical protein
VLAVGCGVHALTLTRKCVPTAPTAPTHPWTHVCTIVPTHARTHSLTHAHAHAHIHTHTQTHIHLLNHSFTHLSSQVTVASNATALFVVLTTQAAGNFETNSFLLAAAGKPARIKDRHQSDARARAHTHTHTHTHIQRVLTCTAHAHTDGGRVSTVVNFVPWDESFGRQGLEVLTSTLRVEHLAENL